MEGNLSVLAIYDVTSLREEVNGFVTKCLALVLESVKRGVCRLKNMHGFIYKPPISKSVIMWGVTV